MTIVCVAPNTNIESTWSVEGFQVGGVFRTRQEVQFASGKGMNVAAGLRILGKQVLGMGFVAGHAGRLFIELAEREGIPGHWTWVDGEERQAIVIYSPGVETPGNTEMSAGGGMQGDDATLISGPGPLVTRQDWLRLQADLLDQAERAEQFIFSGSLPATQAGRGSVETPANQPAPAQNTSEGSLAEIIRALRSMGKPVWVDCEGAALSAVLGARPSGVKINAREAASFTGFPVNDVDAAHAAVEYLLGAGIQSAIITLGKGGAVASVQGIHSLAGSSASGADWWIVSAAQIPRFLSSVGSGDAFLAGLVAGLVEGRDIPDCLRMAAAAGGANAMTLGGGRFSLEDYHEALLTVQVERGR